MTSTINDDNRTLPSRRRTLLRTALILLPAWILLSTAFLWPTADSTRPPFFQLDGGLGHSAYWVTESGGPWGAPIVAIACLILFVWRPDTTTTKKRESLTLLAAIGICAGAGAAINEHVIKEYFQSPRPNIQSLTGGYEPAVDFYRQDQEQRGIRIGEFLSRKPIVLSSQIKQHWIATTGYSFPSGHSFSAMFFATFFLALAISQIQTRRLWIFYLLIPWALAVCYSRTILRVHTPTDITVGALQGFAIGAVAFLFVHSLLQRAQNRIPSQDGNEQ